MNRGFSLIIILLISALAFAKDEKAENKRLLQILEDELQRNFLFLKKQSTPPYFISYSVRDTTNYYIRASFGALEMNNENRVRMLLVEVRVGDYTFDNTHPLRSYDYSPSYSNVFIPVETDEKAIRHILWLETDKSYKNALERYLKRKTEVDIKVIEEDKSDDFSKEKPEKAFLYDQIPALDKEEWIKKVKDYSKLFLTDDKILAGAANFYYTVDNRFLVTTEGTSLTWSSSLARLHIESSTVAQDGMILPIHQTYASYSPAGIPNDAKIVSDIKEMMSNLAGLRDAPQIDPFAGPAILSGRAAGVFFHEVFGHRVEGHRQKDVKEGQTFKGKVGERILPDFISVVFDPTTKKVGDMEVVGYYPFDDQGVRAQRVVTVEDGIFKSFLMSRSPIGGFLKSNGHGRAQAGYIPVARQSNLILLSKKTVSLAELKQMLIDECRRQGKPFGLYFKDIQGGFTFTGRTIPNAFNVMPILVYRIYTDGREEMVRGVDLIGTPLTALTKIIATSDKLEVFNGVCGAESGWVPVSASSPALLLSQIEVQRKEKSQERPPILPPPPIEIPEKEGEKR